MYEVKTQGHNRDSFTRMRKAFGHSLSQGTPQKVAVYCGYAPWPAKVAQIQPHNKQ